MLPISRVLALAAVVAFALPSQGLAPPLNGCSVQGVGACTFACRADEVIRAEAEAHPGAYVELRCGEWVIWSCFVNGFPYYPCGVNASPGENGPGTCVAEGPAILLVCISQGLS